MITKIELIDSETVAVHYSDREVETIAYWLYLLRFFPDLFAMYSKRMESYSGAWNLRIAELGNDEQETIYRAIRGIGDGGYFDIKVFYAGKCFVVGFNYILEG